MRERRRRNRYRIERNKLSSTLQRLGVSWQDIRRLPDLFFCATEILRQLRKEMIRLNLDLARTFSEPADQAASGSFLVSSRVISPSLEDGLSDEDGSDNDDYSRIWMRQRSMVFQREEKLRLVVEQLQRERLVSLSPRRISDIGRLGQLMDANEVIVQLSNRVAYSRERLTSSRQSRTV